MAQLKSLAFCNIFIFVFIQHRFFVSIFRTHFCPKAEKHHIIATAISHNDVMNYANHLSRVYFRSGFFREKVNALGLLRFCIENTTSWLNASYYFHKDMLGFPLV